MALDGLVSAIAGPAGLQLTTPYMAVYNAFHGPNSEVRYTALAGSYDPACFVLNPFCRPLQRLLLALSGSPGDTVVPMASVHVLPYTADRNFQSSGSNMDATHSCMLTFTGCQLQSDAVFDQVSDLVRAKGSSSSPFGVASPASPSTATIAGSLAQGESVERTLPIDAASPALFYLLFPSGDLDLVLVSPSGVTIDPLVADVDPDIEHDDGELFDGKLEVYGLLHPEVGVWTLRIRAPIVSDPSGRTGFLAAGVLESHALVLQTEIVEISVSSGEPLVFLGTVLQAGLSVPGATIAAMVATPDGRTLSVGLHDDGIGRHHKHATAGSP